MRIEVLSTFLDGRTRYEEGDVRNVPDEDGAYFVAHGWAKDLDGNVETGTEQDGPVDHVPRDLREDRDAASAAEVDLSAADEEEDA